jgi:Ino eighty subunit 1
MASHSDFISLTSSLPGYNQNPVFQVASDDNISNPARDPNSPVPPPPPRGGYRSKPMTTTTFVNKTTEYNSDTDRTRSASPPMAGQSAFPSKPTASSMRITTMLNDDAPAPPPAKPKGPGRGNWRRNHPATHHTPRSFAAALEQTPIDTASPASSIAAPPTAAGPHGYYLPLNGTDPPHKRSRPLTSHQLALERFRKARVDHILDRNWRASLGESKKRRKKESAVMRTWKRLKALPSGYDSEEEAIKQQGEAAEGLLMLASLRRGPWEQDDWGEEAGAVASTLRKASRRLNRWEKGEGVVRKKVGGPVHVGLPTEAPLGGRLGDLVRGEQDEGSVGDVASSPPAGADAEDEEQNDNDNEDDDAENGDEDADEDEDEDMMDVEDPPPPRPQQQQRLVPAPLDPAYITAV